MAAPTQDEVTAVVASHRHLQDAVDYAGTLVFAEENIEGTRYRYVLSQHSDYREGE